jgi:multidrug efflux system outer membrane protein
MKKVITILASILVFSCTLAPKYKTPENSLAFENEEKALILQDFLMQDVLKEIAKEVLVNNRDIKISLKNLEIAKMNLNVANSYLLPTINGGFSHYKTNSSTQMQPNYSALLSASYELDFFGTIQSLRTIQKEQFFIATEMQKSLSLSVVYETLSLYFTLLSERDAIEEQENIIKLQESYFELIELKYKNGILNQKDFLTFSMNFNQINASFNAKVANFERLKNAFILMLGSQEKAEKFLANEYSLKGIQLNEGMLYTTTSKALLKRPDIKIAEHSLKIANANIGIARASFFPSINLFSSFGYASQDLSNLFSDGKWAFNPSITIPIFTAGRNRANLKIAHLRKEISIMEYERAIQNAFLDVKFGLKQRETSFKSLEFNEKAFEDAKANFTFAQIKYKNGLTDISHFTTSGVEYLIAMQNFNVSKANYLSSLIYIFKAFGGEEAN